MKGRVLSRPICGFSSAQKRGRRLRMISSVLMARVALLKLSGPPRHGPTVLSANGRGPDHVEVPWRDQWEGFPAADVGADGRLRFWIHVKRGHLPAQFSEGPVPEKSSSSRLGIYQLRPAEHPHHRKPAKQEAGVAAERLAPVQRRLPVQPWPVHVFSGRGRKQTADLRAMMLHLGNVQANARGGKYLPAEPPVQFRHPVGGDPLGALQLRGQGRSRQPVPQHDQRSRQVREGPGTAGRAPSCSQDVSNVRPASH